MGIRLKYSLKKAGAAEESNVDFEIGVNAPAVIVLQVEENPCKACDFLLFGH